MTAAAVLTAIGVGFAIYKGRGSKVLEAAENGADSLAKKGQEAVTHQKTDVPQTKTPDTAVPEKPTGQPKIKEDANPEVGKADGLEELKILKLKKDYSKFIDNQYGIDAKIDDEVLEIINKMYERKGLNPIFNLESN